MEEENTTIGFVEMKRLVEETEKVERAVRKVQREGIAR
jgi:hypothetical protein